MEGTQSEPIAPITVLLDILAYDIQNIDIRSDLIDHISRYPTLTYHGLTPFLNIVTKGRTQKHDLS